MSRISTILRALFHRHEPDLKASHWQGGSFVTDCQGCGEQMFKPAGGTWRIAERR
jgi:hypothetical protein